MKWSPCPASAITSRAAASTATTSAPTASAARPAAWRRRDQVVDLALPVGRGPHDQTCGSCRRGSRRPRAEVDLEEVAGLSTVRVGPVVRDRAVRRRRRRSSRTTAPRRRAQHPGLQLAGDLALGAARPQRPRRPAPPAPGRRRAGPAQRLDLAVVLDRAQRLDRAPDDASSGTRAAGRGVGQHRLQRGQPVDGQVVRLEAEPARCRPGPRGQRRARCRDRPAARRRRPPRPACVA